MGAQENSWVPCPTLAVGMRGTPLIRQVPIRSGIEV
ncbi:hypothetical protein Pan216_36260 [Planctomycetes bacterium Pan216]|uniref:Uncharacterized protein n=1 Tax=Kolteria novifilia TaxID=2527975 RepID=A0A518B718_9BACT|nr:hypothetical protein Pan216_36260 [Planctomycetes bacterium Pan216]